MTERCEIPVVVVFGPTASGKTALAGNLLASRPPSVPALAHLDRLRGRCEVISADSMQVYRGMDIGTAKPDADFLSCLPHHLLDICEINQQFSAGDFVRLADIACADIVSQGKLPVILGGTAFYIRNFLYGLPTTPESDPSLRAFLRSRLEKEGSVVLHAELAASDPVSAAGIHPHDAYRIVRALEVFASSGRPRSSFSLSLVPRPGYRFLVIALDRLRDDLYRRIDLRVDEMLAGGLADEFRSLVRAGYTRDDPGMQAIGYREFFAIDPTGADSGAIRDHICQDSRKYAKRQDTFIRAMPSVLHLDAEDFESIYAAMTAFWGSALDGFRDSVHT